MTQVRSENRRAVDPALFAGIDVGATKVHIADTAETSVRRYDTAAFADIYGILDDYVSCLANHPSKVVVGMAGPRDDDTGITTLTNGTWPPFDPRQASARYDTQFTTANDLAITTAGVIAASGIGLQTLKEGRPTRTGTRVVVSFGTGTGVGAAVWDDAAAHFTVVATEGGHIGFQPQNDAEAEYCRYLQQRYAHASVEFALSGGYGLGNLVDFSLQALARDTLRRAVTSAREDPDRPIGAVLLAFASEGSGDDQRAAATILKRMGAMVGSVLRDLTLVYKATGGVYLTGSVSLALAAYWSECSDLRERFIRRGAVHDELVEQVPIYLITDPNVAAMGALTLARR